MCLISFAINYHPKYPFLLVANRDEFYDRPTLPAGFWVENKNILGGRDLKAGGTWMGITTNGRFAAVTNYRDIKNIKENAKSRGDLTSNFLLEDLEMDPYLEKVKAESDLYNGFNLLLMEKNTMKHFSNYEGTINSIEKGKIYGLSNALLDTAWPKVKTIKSRFKELIKEPFMIEDLIGMMSDQSPAPLEELPDTGIPTAWEKSLSSICIRTDNYGTCSTTAIMIDLAGKLTFMEKTYAVGSREEKTNRFELYIN